MTADEEIRLYQCRACSAVAAVRVGGCPNCGNTEGPTRTVNTVDGGTTERTKPWHKTLRVQGTTYD